MSGVEDVLKDLEDGSEGGNDGNNTGDDGGGSNDNTDNGAGTKDGDTGADSSNANDDSSSDGDSDGSTEPEGDDELSALDKIKSDQAELRQMLRVSRRENAAMKAKLERLSGKKVPVADDLDGDLSDGEEGEKLSRIEELQLSLRNISDTRGASLELLAEQMAETQKYADVAEVCSRQNMDDVLESAATALQEQNGGDFNELILELESSIWSKQNPYKYLYDLVKTYHPKYQKADAGEGKKKTPSKAASSIQDMGGAGDKDSGKGGWTADKIDAMPEDELGKVPADIYDKYLSGELD